jgi:hypothetical protein
MGRRGGNMAGERDDTRSDKLEGDGTWGSGASFYWGSRKWLL